MESRCEVCGHDSDRPIRIMQSGRQHVFDTFECAIHAMAPACGNCSVRIIGHGVERDAKAFCSIHCSDTAAAKEPPSDRAHEERQRRKAVFPPDPDIARKRVS